MMKCIVKWLVFKLIYPCWYGIAAKKHINRHKVIFVENHQEYLTDNFERIYKEFQRRNYDIRVYYLKVASSGWKDIIVRSLRLIWDMGDARFVFINESNSLFGAFSLRGETEIIQLWHACGAFKKWGYSVADKSFGEDSRALKQYSAHRNYSLVPVSSDEVCWAYEEAFGIEGKGIVKPLGVSRTDLFFEETFHREACSRLHQLIPQSKGKKVILYAPTFRGEIRDAVAPDALQIEDFYKRFHGEYVLLIKNHPFVKKEMEIPAECTEFCIDIGNKLSIAELLVVSDLCITDYSSIIFEYSLLHKPIFFFAYDLESYYDERGFYYPYETFVPGPVVKTSEELADAVTQINRFDYDKLETFRHRFMSGCDGHATERIIEEICKSERH